jgi:hypothetical protein
MIGNTIAGLLGGGAVPFSPLSIANCKLWLDASDTATISLSGSSVTQWNDKSTNGFNVTQATGARQPSSGINTQNSLNVITFGGDDLVAAATASDWNFLHNSTGATIFVALFSNTSAVYGELLCTSASSATSGMYSQRSATDQISIAIERGVAGQRASELDAGTLTDNQASYFSAVIDTGNATAVNRLIYKVKGGADLTGNIKTGAASAANASFALRIGSSSTSGADGFSGRICEIIMYSGILSGTDITSVNSYLGTKWGI